MKMNQEKLATYFKKPQKYQKFGTVKARLAVPGENVVTTIDGKQETRNTAKANDMIITGSSDEQYIISLKKFLERYKGPSPSMKIQTYEAVGFCYAVEWKDKPAQFDASWGEHMIIEPGDMLCSTTEIPNGDLYRIEKNTFGKTYRK